jgi:hypothetical protein
LKNYLEVFAVVELQISTFSAYTIACVKRSAVCAAVMGGISIR